MGLVKKIAETAFYGLATSTGVGAIWLCGDYISSGTIQNGPGIMMNAFLGGAIGVPLSVVGGILLGKSLYHMITGDFDSEWG
jgi:hypothetical protein